MRIEVKAFGILVLSGIIGIIFAIIEQMMYANGFLINEYITGTITLKAVQLATVLAWMIFGLVIFAIEQ